MKKVKMQLLAIAKREDNVFGLEYIGLSRIKAFLLKNYMFVEDDYIYIEKDIEHEFKKIDLTCDIFGFTAYLFNIEYINEICQRIKEHNNKAITVVGSQFATLCSNEILEKFDYIDCIVLGHGENTTLDIIEKVKNGYSIEEIAAENIHIITRENNNLHKKINYIDINELPWPNRSYLHSNNYLMAYISDAHGCLGNCSFCTYDKGYNTRSAKDIMNEIISIYNSTGIRMYRFTSGCFVNNIDIDKLKIKELCDLIINCPIKFSFKCFTRADSFKDTSEDIELLKLMKKAGFNTFYVGIESGNNEDLLIYNKNITVIDNHKALNTLRNVDISFNNFGFIMFNPYSDLKKLSLNYNFLKEYKCPYIIKYFNMLRVSYNTPIYHRLKQEDLLKDNYSFLNEIEWKFLDPDVAEVYEFLKINFIDKIDTPKFSQMIELVNYVNSITEINDIKSELEKYVTMATKDIEEYFYSLFIKNDISTCKKDYSEFINKLKKYDNLCDSLNKKIYLKALRLRKKPDHEISFLISES